MKNYFAIILFLFCFQNLVFSQNKVSLIKSETLEQLFANNPNKRFIVNFWATWCGPCLAELPDFQYFYRNNSNKNVVLILVSLDFSNEIEKVNNFIVKKNLTMPIYLLNETDQNSFINKVDKNWEGTIPATWFVNTKTQKKLLIEKPLNDNEISFYLNQID